MNCFAALRACWNAGHPEHWSDGGEMFPEIRIEGRSSPAEGSSGGITRVSSSLKPSQEALYDWDRARGAAGNAPSDSSSGLQIPTLDKDEHTRSIEANYLAAEKYLRRYRNRNELGIPVGLRQSELRYARMRAYIDDALDHYGRYEDPNA